MRASLLVAWVLRFIVAVAFFYFGFIHYRDPGYAAQFVVWGYPAGWHQFTSLIEVIGAVLIIIPTTTLVGVGLLGALLAAAIITLLIHDGGATVLIPLVVLVAVAALGWLRWSERV